MTNNAQTIAEEIREVADGVSDVPLSKLAPKIKWGDEFLAWDTEKKITYLMKFAEGMNDAVDKIQRERDALGKLAEQKEKQIQQVKPMMEANNQLLQSEITQMNEYKQKTNATIAALNRRVRELESGNFD